MNFRFLLFILLVFVSLLLVDSYISSIDSLSNNAGSFVNNDFAVYPIDYSVNTLPSYVDSNLFTQYDQYRILDNSLEYVMYWSIDVSNQMASIAISANTQGWLALGLSRLGLMIQSDVWVAWVTDSQYTGPDVKSNIGFVNDLFIGSRQQLCPIGVCLDTNQGGSYSIQNITGYYNTVTNHSTVQFSRALNTGDVNYDYIIPENESFLIYAVAHEDSDTLQYHGPTHRGQLQHTWYISHNHYVSQQAAESIISNDDYIVSNAFVTFPNLLAVQVSLLYLVIVAFYFLRYLMAYRICYRIYYFLSIAALLYSIAQWIILIAYSKNVTFSLDSSSIRDYNKVHFALSFLFYISLWIFVPCSIYYFEVLAKKNLKGSQIRTSRTSRDGQDLSKKNQTSVNEEAIGTLERFIAKFTEFITFKTNLFVIAIGITMFQIGLLVSPNLFGYHSNGVRYAFWFTIAFFGSSYVLQQIIQSYARIYYTVSLVAASKEVTSSGLLVSNDREITLAKNKPFQFRWLPRTAYVTAILCIPMIIIAALLASQYSHFDTDSSTSTTTASNSQYTTSAGSDIVNNTVLNEFPPVDPNNYQFLRRYYIGCQEGIWDYAPNGIIMGQINVNQTYLNDAPYRPALPIESPDQEISIDSDGHFGSKWLKARYVYYTDDTFTTVMPLDPRDTHMGIISNVVRAFVGDTISILFWNNCTFPYSLHPHGAFYNHGNEGASYYNGAPSSSQDGVKPGSTGQYYWPVFARSGPAPDQSVDSIFFSFHSHHNERNDFNSGLLSGMIIYAQGAAVADSNGILRSISVDREFVLVQSSYDETLSNYWNSNVFTWASNPKVNFLNKPINSVYNYITDMPTILTQLGTEPLANVDLSFYWLNSRFGINGLTYGNLQLNMNTNERIRVYLNSFAGGREHWWHTYQFRGHTLIHNNIRMDSIPVEPASMLVADMYTGPTIGSYALVCNSLFHLRLGSIARYTILSKPLNYIGDPDLTQIQNFPMTRVPIPTITTPPSPQNVNKVIYYIAAEIEYNWDLMPGGLMADLNGNIVPIDQVANLTESVRQQILSEPSNGFWAYNPIINGQRWPGVWNKLRYIEYTDETFSTPVIRSARDQHLELLGPIIRAEVGQVVQIVFKNKIPAINQIDVNIRPRGGIISIDINGNILDNSLDITPILSGEIMTYYWYISESSGPSINSQSNSIAWLYSSTLDPESSDTAGLVGPIIITKIGCAVINDGGNIRAVADLSEMHNSYPNDVDLDYIIWMSTIDERTSSMWRNQTIFGESGQIDGAVLAARYSPNSPVAPYINTYQQLDPSSLYVINFRQYGNLQGLTATVGDRVRWYVLGGGFFADSHAPSWHGHTGLWEGYRIDQTDTIPGTQTVVDMIMQIPGQHMLECHQTEHYGQFAIYYVNPSTTPASNINNAIFETSSTSQHHVHYIAAVEEIWNYIPHMKNNIDNGPLEAVALGGTVGFDLADIPPVYKPTFFGLPKWPNGDYARVPQDPIWDPPGPSGTCAYIEKINCAGVNDNKWAFPAINAPGPYFMKIFYKEYTDATFTTIKPVPNQWAHKGYSGPVLRASVGDTFEIHFKNLLTDITYNSDPTFKLNLFPHGGITVHDDLYYSQLNVFPNQTVSYNWLVGEQSGPGPNDVSSIFHLYHNAMDPNKGASGGLQGIIIVDRPNSTYIDATGATHPIGITDEIVIVLTEQMEYSESPLFNYNVFNLFPAQFPNGSDVNAIQQDMLSSGFGPVMAYSSFSALTNWNVWAINGYAYNNQIPLPDDPYGPYKEYIVHEGTVARWYVYDNGGLAHPFHWHAQTGIWRHKRVDAIDIYAASFNVFDMLADNPGRWQMHCHINEHFAQGMSATYVVIPKDAGIFELPTNINGLTSSEVNSVSLGSTGYQLTWSITSDGTGIEITMSAPGQVWIGFGVGSGMTNADMAIGTYTDNGPIVQDYYALGHLIPQTDVSLGGENNIIFVTGSQKNGRSSFTFIRPLAANDQYDNAFSTTDITSFVFAFGTTETFAYHSESNRGVVNSINFAAGASVGGNVAVSSSTLYNDSHIYFVHAVGMVIAWAILAPAAFIIARYYKHQSWWIDFHRGINMAVTFITVVLAVAMITQRPFLAIQTVHGYIGIIILSVVIFQTSLGLSNLFLKKQPLNRPAPANANNPNQMIKINNNGDGHKKSIKVNKGSIVTVTPPVLPTTKFKKAAQGRVLNRTVLILGTQTLISMLHTHIGWCVIIAGNVNLILGTYLLYTQDTRYIGLLGAWMALLVLICVYLEEIRFLRLLSCCYREKGYDNLKVEDDYTTQNILQQLQATDMSKKSLNSTDNNNNNNNNNNPNNSNDNPISPSNKDPENSAFRRAVTINDQNGNSNSNSKNKTHVNESNHSAPTGPVIINRAQFKAFIDSGKKLIIMNNGVYDIEEFEDIHPGGMLVFQSVIGLDITEYFLFGSTASSGHSHLHSSIAREIIKEYQVGILQDPDIDPSLKSAGSISHVITHFHGTNTDENSAIDAQSNNPTNTNNINNHNNTNFRIDEEQVELQVLTTNSENEEKARNIV